MENALLFTALLLGAAVLGGFIGACCSKGRQAGDHEGRIAELEDRLDALADHCMEEAKNVKARVGALEDAMDAFQTHCLEQEQAIHAELDEHEFLIGDTPTGGLLGRVGALEEKARKEAQGGR
jgi:outer membrane murein-binding lipoprotein Lpp